MYDVIVVGARCAGASTAMLLGRKGYKVLLVDRARFPKDIPHGHFIHRHGPARLARWGLLDRIVATGCPPVTSVSTDYGDCALASENLSIEGVALGYGPRRAPLDKVLVDAAVEAGVELRDGFAVDGFSTDGDCVTGIRGTDRAGGSSVAEYARLTIGADGRNSRLAKAVSAPQYEMTPPLTCWFFSYWSGVNLDRLQIAVRTNKVLFSFPTNDDLFAIFAAWTSSELPAIRADVEGRFMAFLDEVPDLAGKVRSGRREERFYGMPDVPNFLRKAYGRGWALVGDAGCHKDPFLALGICDAFRDAELLADAVDSALSGDVDSAEAMAGYERRRNEATMADYQQNLAQAQFQPLPPEMAQLRRALRGNAADTHRYYLAIEGMVPPEAFFNPDNMARILGSGRH